MMKEAIILNVFKILAIILATTLHEFIRAAVSTAFGDKMPKDKGRLTLNPLKHFEPIGFILMFATGFGWGKPVETSALYYKNRKKATLYTAILPTVSNILLAIICAMILGVSMLGKLSVGYLSTFLIWIIYYNVSLSVYNLVPIVPMDCTKVLSAVMPANRYFQYLQYEKIYQMVFLLFMFLGLTNMLFTPIISFVQNLIVSGMFSFIQMIDMLVKMVIA